MPPDAALFDAARDTLTALGIDIAAWALSAARVFPLVFLVPAFGLRAVPAPVRLVMALTLGLAAFPAARPSDAAPLAAQLLMELVKGLPVAVTTAGGLWIASMSGGLMDDLRGSHERVALPNIEGEPSPLGAVFGMLAGLGFLVSGGPVRAVRALAAAPDSIEGSARHVAHALTSGIELAVAIAAPLLAVSVLVELAGALVSRAAAPAAVQPLIAPLRSFVVLGVVALLLDRIAALVVAG